VLGSGNIETLLVLTTIAIVSLLTLAALESVRTYVMIGLSSWMSRKLGGAILGSSVTSALSQSNDPSVRGLRDLETVRTFLTGPGVFAVLDAPWMPVFLAVIFFVHPMLGWIATVGALILFGLALMNELATREPLAQAGAESQRTTHRAETAVRNADMISAMKPSGSDEMGTRRFVVVGAVIILIFFGFFGGRAFMAPLDSAAIAIGSVGVEGNRRTVQHLEGGIVDQIFVRNGDRVESGQVLIRLDETQPRAQLQLIRGQRNAALALAARLRAERDGNAGIAFPDELVDQAGDPRIDEVMLGQLGILEARREAIEGQRKILGQRVAQFREEITGLQAQIRSVDEQLRLIRDEEADLQSLLDKGLTPKSRVLSLQRRAAEIEGERGQNVAAIARARQNIAEAEIRIFELRTEQVNEVVAELRQVETELLDLEERLRAAEDVVRRIDVKSPADGFVVDMQVFTTGGVIQPGQRLLDVVPGNEKLVIEARLQPTDIDVVYAGLPAQVRLSAFNQRIIPTVDGTVSWVSADRLTDETTGEAYYTARVELNDPNDPRLAGLTLQPGMPAEVLIRTGDRTLVQYLVSPVEQSISRSLREQ
jgi:HlyD family type I secretion membrane fusion protein